MALINCPDCGKEVSSNAPSCLGCGAPIAGALPYTDHEVAVMQANAEVAGRSETQATESRQVSFLLAAGIFWLLSFLKTLSAREI